MEFLKSNRRFDFLYGGKPFSELEFTVEQTEDVDSLKTVYTFPDGLKITNIATKHDDAYEWVNWLENTSDSPTEIISELYDACVSLPMPHEDAPERSAFLPDFDKLTAVYSPTGSTWCHDEFSCYADRCADNKFFGQLSVGKIKSYSTSGGRSSEQNAPFFNVHKVGTGYIFAIGWTGQWNCILERTPDDIIIKTKIEDTHFRLLPGEKIRTSSFVLMPYQCDLLQSHNKWRRLVKEHFSLIGSVGRDTHGPLCTSFWGGLKSEIIIDRINTIRKNGLPFEYVWMDAGWYGDTMPTSDEFKGDWSEHTGDWRISPHTHPGGLVDVSQAVHNAGMKFLLWFEPERVKKSVPIVRKHPEYFLYHDDEKITSLILNLGDENAWNYCFNTVSCLIEALGIDCYRQDFNRAPLEFWRKYDSEDRQGITEIKHINGLYRFWDALLLKFPHLIIDNCASGGRRIDIETLRRSIPLWRSDYQCPANFFAESTQCHTLTFSKWLPFSGTSCGRDYDTYRMRGAYTPALTTNFAYNDRMTFGDDPNKMAWLKKYLEEYLKVRPYLTEDFYPLTEVSDRKDVWCAWQYHRPSENDGMVQIFRRENSPYDSASFDLFGIDNSATYVFTDADDQKEITISGAELAKKGFCVNIGKKRSAKIYFYKKA